METEKIARSCTKMHTNTLRGRYLWSVGSTFKTYSTPSSNKEIASAKKSPAVTQICRCICWLLLRFCRATQFPQMKIMTSDCANSL